ncbi:MAG TPA: pitrilysin family protein [Candidatus Paceibacterota bacterium]|jgi:zinc protease
METLIRNIKECRSDGMRFFAARTGAKDVVSIEGSVLGGSYLLPYEKRPAHGLMASILDAGTKRRDKETLRNDLAERGIILHFSSGADRTYFFASCLPEDITYTLRLIAECLESPLLAKSEFEAERARSLAMLSEAQTDTDAQASRAFARLVFDPVHVNYADSIEEERSLTRGVSRADILTSQRMIGRGGLVLAVTGDLVPERTLSEAERVFIKLPSGTENLPAKPANQKEVTRGESLVHVPDKTNVDTYFGLSVPITHNDSRYVPFAVLSSMLCGGGVFSSHLAQTIRERDGLTYAIAGGPYGFGEGAQGALRVWANFAPDRFRYSVEATLKEIRIFFKQGVTIESLATMQSRMQGLYVTSLSNSRGIAAQLHKIGREGKQLTYVNEFPSLIRAVTLTDLQEAAALIPVDKFSLAAAGTFKKP